MTPTQIRKAEQLLAKKKEMLTLVDRWGHVWGSVASEGQGKAALLLNMQGHVSVDTLERWIKQAKIAVKKKIV